MGRRTSAWIAGTLGVGLTASIVLAQQMPGSGGAPQAGSGASDASASEPASIYGASSSRGARYLMRNGLDYLQYQEYERALKFLRDAEAKQKELSAREVQELKRGIERAQAGLRAAADATAPYALSDQSRRRNGFTAARPEAQTAVAARTGATDSQVRVGARLDRSVRADIGSGAGAVANVNTGPGRTADDAPGEPIRLASAETEVVTPSGTPGAGTGPSPAQAANTAAPADPQSATAEIPALAAPGLPTLTAVPSSPDAAAGAGTPPTEPQDGTTAPATAPSGGSTAHVAPAQEPPAQAPPPATTAPRTITPAPIPADVAPAPILLETPDSVASKPEPAANPAARPAPEPSAAPAVPALSSPEPPAAAPALIPAPDPAAGAAPAAAPATGGLIPAAMQQPAAAAPVSVPAAPNVGSEGTAPATEPVPAASISPPAADPDTAPLPPLGAAAAQPAVVGGTPHRESEEPAPVASTAPEPVAAATSPGPAADPAPAPASDELPPLPTDLSRDAGAAPPVQTPAAAPPAAELPAAAPTPAPPADEAPKPEPIAPAAAPEIPPAVPAGSIPPAETGQPLLPSPEDAPAGSAPSTAVAPAPEPTPAPVADPGSTVPAAPAAAADERPIPVPQPEADAPVGAATAPVAGSSLPSPSAPAATGDPAPAAGSSEARFFLPPRVTPPTRLRPFEERRVTEIMARQEREDVVRNQIQARPQPAPDGSLPREASSSNLQTQTQYDISRAPSPAEARPIKAIPVPEDWVPLAARNWSPQRKYWAAAATCHLPLYFQDAALERYGHPVEQFVGPMGRYLSYPVDDPDQSTQRNQIIQPFFSAGLMALQIAAWPYNAIMDPPWEAQYDLGYYRPGDMVPTDIYWLPLHGYGPPLRGNSY